jgi:hypothetical protein
LPIDGAALHITSSKKEHRDDELRTHAPSDRPTSANITGFTGGGMEGGTFGAAVDAKDDAWFTTYGSNATAVF